MLPLAVGSGCSAVKVNWQSTCWRCLDPGAPCSETRHQRQGRQYTPRARAAYLQRPAVCNATCEISTCLRTFGFADFCYSKYSSQHFDVLQYLLLSTLVSGWVPTLLRAGRGMMRYDRADRQAPPQLLTLYDYDGNQFSRLVSAFRS